jgi:hypothetical protein
VAGVTAAIIMPDPEDKAPVPFEDDANTPENTLYRIAMEEWE